MSKVVSASTGRRYSLQRVCRVWDVPRSTVYHHRRAPQRSPQRKRGPKTALSDQDLLEAIRGALEDSPWTGEGYRKVWARLRLNGVRTSKERVRRLMRDAGLLSMSTLFDGFVVEEIDGRGGCRAVLSGGFHRACRSPGDGSWDWDAGFEATFEMVDVEGIDADQLDLVDDGQEIGQGANWPEGRRL